jgi:hypothetical protein
MESALASETIKLLVGPKRKAFVVHRDLIISLVPRLKTLNTLFSLLKKDKTYIRGEEKDDEIYIPGAEPVAVHLFVCWLYRGTSALSVTGKDLVPLVHLYGIARRWHQPALQNAVIDALITHFRDVDNMDLKPMQEVMQRCYLEVRLSEKLQSLLMFHTAVAFNQLSRINPVGALSRLHALLKSDEDFAVGFGIWQMVNADMTRPENLCYMEGINKKFHV